MPSARPHTTRTAGSVLLAALVLAAVAALVINGSPPARAATASQLRQRISSGEGRISALSGAVRSANHQVARLGASVATLQAQIVRLQADLNAKRAELLKLRVELAAAHARLLRLEAVQAHSEAVLAQQLVGSYETSSPNLVDVVLEATGFDNLLERLSFEQRIGKHDARILGQVRAARRAVAAEAVRLGALSARQQELTAQALAERNRVARTRVQVVSEQLAAIHVRNSKAGALSATRGQVASLRSQLGNLIAAEQRAAAAAQSPASGSSPSAPVQRSSSGGFTFPMPKGDVSPPATWSLDQGVDISAPGGTPEFAVCSGTVVLHGIGGFGPSAPVIHCDSPLDGYDYVYYGHAGPGNWTPVGAHVSQGQVISEVGYGIVGISSGPHLEIGFADSSGSPVGSQTAPTMMSLLQGAYGG